MDAVVGEFAEGLCGVGEIDCVGLHELMLVAASVFVDDVCDDYCWYVGDG